MIEVIAGHSVVRPPCKDTTLCMVNIIVLTVAVISIATINFFAMSCKLSIALRSLSPLPHGINSHTSGSYSRCNLSLTA
jgi:hypothetical protein